MRLPCKLAFKKLYINPHQLKKVENLLDNPKYYIALVAIFRNEDRFLKEWIEFYKLMGVEHFYLYNHLSNDNFKEILTPYIKEGIVDLYDVYLEPNNLLEWNKLQTQVYTEIAKKTKNLVEWLIVVDTDEFLFPLKEDNLKTLLQNYDQYATLSVNWRIYGSGSVNRIPNGQLLTETLTFASEAKDLHVKSIVKPRYVEKFLNPHFAQLKPGYGQVTENFDYFSGPFLPDETRNIVRINHYWARDYDFFKSTKLARVHVVNKNLSAEEKQLKTNSLIKQNKDASSKFDGSILRFVSKLRDKVFLFNSD